MGTFLAAVEAKKIPRGSVLIVENLDRLGRLPVVKQFTVFLNIINAGVTIVSTMDGAEYSQESPNGEHGMGLLMSSISVMKRAFDESETKSKRSKANWEKKRELKGVGTKRTPGWIEVIDGRYRLIPERVLVLRRIYQETSVEVFKKKLAEQRRAFERKGGRVRVIYVLFRTGIVRKIHVQTVDGKTKVNATEAREMMTGHLERSGKKVGLRIKLRARAFTVTAENSLPGGGKRSLTALQVHYAWQSLSADHNMFGDLIADYSKPLSAEAQKTARKAIEDFRKWQEKNGPKQKAKKT